MPKNPEREGSPRLITPQEIEQEYEIKRSTLYTYRHRPTFPKPVKVEGSIKTFYRADEVAAWIAANPKQQGKRTDLAPDPDQGEPVTTTDAPREWRLTPKTLNLFVRALVNHVDYDIHKGYECGEEDGADHYPELVGEAAEMLDAITGAVPDSGKSAASWQSAAAEIEARQDRLDAERRAEIGELDRDDELEGAGARSAAAHLRRRADEAEASDG